MIHTLAQLGERLWMPDAESTYASNMDWVFYFLYWMSVIAFVAVVATMIFFVIRYRHRPGHTEKPSPSHSTTLELTWSIIPAILMMVVFYYGFRTFLDMATPPDNSYTVNVRAYKWGWEFTYPNGATAPDLYAPKDRPVKVVLQSDDVIHSFFVPAFRVKKDLVPGRYNTTWFQVKEIPPQRFDVPERIEDPVSKQMVTNPDYGQRFYDLYCAEYCGTKHSLMRAKVLVMEWEQFQAWLAEANDPTKEPPVQAGLKLYRSKGCVQCHTLDGGGSIGPSLKNVYGTERAMTDGAKPIADENYIRESILYPAKHIRAGYTNQMNSFLGKIKDVEITALIEMMKSISDQAPKPMEAWPETQQTVK
jgi:cytochrome c oxidase subunit 2